MIGGLLFATVATLFFVPVVFAIVHSWGEKDEKGPSESSAELVICGPGRGSAEAAPNLRKEMVKMPANEPELAKRATCLYWGLEPPRKGLCQRHAPVAGDSELVAHWPHTKDWQWCGEYVPDVGQGLIHCLDCRFWPPEWS